jgi:sigma-B regulation protein RsbU (phosphoserine phosphatase)
MSALPDGRTRAITERLRDIEAVTDAGLAQLTLEELLVELLDRVREILAADTAAVLLLDDANQQLVATAARGIEEEVYQGVRVPLGRGFAGRVAATRQAQAIENIDDADVVNPLLRDRGIRSLLGVPLLVGGRLLGVLHVGTVTRRHFDDEDADLLQMVADRVALATQASLSESDRNASLVMQRSLLPDQLPDVAGFETAVRYIAGAGTVGGDWYDMFVLPTGRVVVTVGDVVGKGLRAAVVMGRLRSSLRAHGYADQRDPGAVLDLVDSQMQHFEPGQMATAVVACIDADSDRIDVALAGHPAPVMASGDGPGRYLDLAIGPPLGIPSSRPRPTTTVELPPGAVICFYTDGLIERRDVRLDDRISRLCDVVRADPVEQVCSRVMARLIGFERAEDDVALLALRRTTP